MANRISYKSNKKDCNSCPLKEKCISGKSDFRIVSHYDSPCYQQAKEWYESDYGKAMQKLRHTVVEGIFGQAKNYHGMSKTRFRGIERVQIQFLLTATALNLKKMIKRIGTKDIKSKICLDFFEMIQNIMNFFRKFNLIMKF